MFYDELKNTVKYFKETEGERRLRPFVFLFLIRKWNFTIPEFKTAYNNYLKTGTIKETNVDYVMQTLFNLLFMVVDITQASQ